MWNPAYTHASTTYTSYEYTDRLTRCAGWSMDVTGSVIPDPALGGCCGGYPMGGGGPPGGCGWPPGMRAPPPLECGGGWVWAWWSCLGMGCWWPGGMAPWLTGLPSSIRSCILLCCNQSNVSILHFKSMY